MFSKLSISYKILIFNIITVLFVISLIGYLTFNQTKEFLKERYVEEFQRICELKVDRLASVFQTIENNVDFIKSGDDIIDYVSEAQQVIQNSEGIEELIQQMDKRLLPDQSIYYYDNILLTNPEGVILYASDRSGVKIGYSYRKITRTLKQVEGKETFFGEPYRIRNSVQMFIISPIIDSNDAHKGYLLVLYDVTKNIFPIVEDYNQLGVTGEILLSFFDPSFSNPNEGKIKIINTQRHTDNAPLTQIILTNDPVQISVQKAAIGAKSDYALDTDYRGKTTLALWDKVPNVNWGLTIKVDEDEVYSSLEGFIKQYIQVETIVLIVALLAAILFLNYILQPLKLISKKLKTISSGALPKKVEQGNLSKEIASLSNSINRFIDKSKSELGFINSLNNGQWDSSFEAQNNEDLLGNALLVLRENIISKEKSNADEKWIQESLAGLALQLKLFTSFEEFSDTVLKYAIKQLGALQGAFYVLHKSAKKSDYLEMVSCYAYNKKKFRQFTFKVGEGLVGQIAFEKNVSLITEVPDNYPSITSGLVGEKKPKSLLFIPLVNEGEVLGIIEIAGLKRFNERDIKLAKDMAKIIVREIEILALIKAK